MGVQGRSGARRLLVQALYQAQLTGHERDEIEQQFSDQPDFAATDSAYFLKLLSEIHGSRDVLDNDIYLFGDIAVEQLDPVEHAVLWIALAELKHHQDIPPKVVINEAIELTKTFGAEGGHKYVNGLLDKAAAKFSRA